MDDILEFGVFVLVIFVLIASVCGVATGVRYIGCKSLGVDKPVACAIFGVKNINIQQKDLYNYE